MDRLNEQMNVIFQSVNHSKYFFYRENSFRLTTNFGLYNLDVSALVEIPNVYRITFVAWFSNKVHFLAEHFGGLFFLSLVDISVISCESALI